MTIRPAPVVALVPTRSPGAGKTRLAPGLGPEQRAALGGAMLGDVVATLEASAVDHVVVAASGDRAVAAAAALGVDVLRDPPGTDGLDAAVSAAVRRLGSGATVLVVMADLPCLTPTDVSGLLAPDGAVVIAATDDGGTGGLLRRPVTVIPTAYGPGSAVRHEHLARSSGLDPTVVRLPGFARDVDTWEDLRHLRTATVGPRTARVLAELELSGDAEAAAG